MLGLHDMQGHAGCMQGSNQGAGGRALDISAMMVRHSGLGALVGARLDSSTADVYRSSVRKAASSSPNCCSSTSPWITTGQ